MRRYFAQTTLEQIAKDYVNYYASAYPGTASVTPPTLVEDPLRDLVIVTENYTVSNLWESQAGTTKIKANFFPKPISDYAVRPKTRVRSMPLAVNHPINARLTTTVNLPVSCRCPMTMVLA